MASPFAALMASMRSQVSHIDVDARLTVLAAIVTQELCTLPPGERQKALHGMISKLPTLLSLMERRMRERLVQDARDGF